MKGILYTIKICIISEEYMNYDLTSSFCMLYDEQVGDNWQEFTISP